MMPVPYKCRVCGCDGIAYSSEDGESEFTSIFSRWLTCNRCADYRQGKRKWGEAIASVCVRLRICQLAGTMDQDIEDSARKRLHDLTQSYSHIVCTYHHCEDIWEEEFVNLLIEKPHLIWVTLREYERGVPHTLALCSGGANA